MMKFIKILIFVFILAISCTLSDDSKVGEISEMKAVYIERFTRFIDWPDDDDVRNKDIPFKIAISNDPEFYRVLNEALKGRQIKGKKIEIYQVKNIKEIDNPNILIVSEDDIRFLKTFFPPKKGNAILLISHGKGLAAKGIHINFYTEEKRLKFEINLDSVQLSGFRVRHLLLNMAKIISSEKEVK